MSLRTKLRYKAEAALDQMVNECWITATEQLKGIDGIRPNELLKMAAGGRNNTLKHALVTKITDHKERELEKFFNQQQELLPEEKAGKGKPK